MGNPIEVNGAFFPSWPYDEALAWMETVRQRVLAGDPGVVALGYHRQPVITLGRHASNEQIISPDQRLRPRSAFTKSIAVGRHHSRTRTNCCLSSG